MELTMYFNRPLRGLRPNGLDWMQDDDPLSNSGYGAAPSQQGADRPDFSGYPTWAHGVMTQVYPRLDQAGRLSEPLILEDSAEIEGPTEVYRQVHPLCRKPDPISRACEKEWSEAERYCAIQAFTGAFGKGRGRARSHMGRNIHECICGRVSQGCGGNPTGKTPFDPPPRKGFSGSY
jgi:hypothetical protein